MADHFRKTERGRREVRERSLNLSRTARNLLLILDSSKSLSAWIEMIQGASLADAVALLEAGLIESAPERSSDPTRPAQFEPTEPMGHTGWHVPSAYAGLRDPSARPEGAGPRRSAEPAAPRAPGPISDTDFDALMSDPELLSSRPGSLGAGPRSRPGELGPPSSRPTPLAPAAGRPARPGEASAPATRPPPEPLPAGQPGLGYAELYDSLNALLRESLGLFRGYRYTLRIEKAQSMEELEQVARDFVDEVQRLRGDAMARMVQRALGLGG